MSTLRPTLLVLMLAGLSGALPLTVAAHSGLRFSNPLDGATLGDSPAAIVLTFFEKPEPSLSTIHVIDTNGVAYHGNRPDPLEGDPLSLRMPVKRLGRGVYRVNWRVVSAVDGHASSGVFVFGVLVAPTTQDSAAPSAPADAAYVEASARAVFIAGLVLMLGAAVATLARFGGNREIRLARAGWMGSAVSLGFLVWLQRRAADVPLAQMIETAVGRGLLWRAAALAVAAGAIVVAMRAVARPRPSGSSGARLAAAVLALASIAAMAAHAGTGHAAAAPQWTQVAITVHVVHFAAVAAWIGGLAALVVAVSRTAAIDSVAIRRFSSIAGVALAIVAATGLLRALNEIGAARELIATPYGRVLSVKIALFAALAALGARNRWRNLPVAGSSTAPLRRTAIVELVLAAAAIVATGFLGALAPPGAARAVAGIVATGQDFGTTVRVRFSAASDQPGPNRFDVEALDYDSREPVRDAQVTLQFSALDDTRGTSAVLKIAHDRDGLYVGSGAPLAFDGRWNVTVLIERGGGSVSVPMIIETRTPPRFVSILRRPGAPPVYTVEVKGRANVRVAADPGRSGVNRLSIAFFSGYMEPMPADGVVVTQGTGADARPLGVTRTSATEFVADATLDRGNNRIAVIGHTANGTRIRITLVMPLDY